MSTQAVTPDQLLNFFQAHPELVKDTPTLQDAVLLAPHFYYKNDGMYRNVVLYKIHSIDTNCTVLFNLSNFTLLILTPQKRSFEIYMSHRNRKRLSDRTTIWNLLRHIEHACYNALLCDTRVSKRG